MSCKEHLRPLCNKAIVCSNNKETVPLTIFFFLLKNCSVGCWISEENTLMLISLNIAKTTCALAFHYWFEPLNKGWYVACTTADEHDWKSRLKEKEMLLVGSY